MANIGIIIGSAFLKGKHFSGLRTKIVKTSFGKVKFKIDKDIYYLQRHEGNTPPHMINHKINIQSFYNSGIKKIIAINSCGSLRKNIKPETIVIPDDYIDWQNQYTFFDSNIKFTIPGISNQLRDMIIKVARQNKIKILDKGVYWQSHGPRFETKAEARLMSQFADIVGMTMANEASLASELEIEYASICLVDNYANGVGVKQLTIEECYKGQERTQKKAIQLLNKVLAGFV